MKTTEIEIRLAAALDLYREEMPAIDGELFADELSGKVVKAIRENPEIDLTEFLSPGELLRFHQEGQRHIESDVGKGPEIVQGLRLKLDEERGKLWAGLPAPLSFAGLAKDPPARPPAVISGVLLSGGKLLITGASKIRKTWLLMHLAAAVATGNEWLGFRTIKGGVLVLDLELMSHEGPERLTRICRAMGVEYPENLYITQWRGHGIHPEKIEEALVEFALRNRICLILVDPLYKWTGGADEIAVSEVYRYLEQLERIGRRAGAAIAFSHHHAKGDASGRNAIDLASGSGVFARDPDALLSIRETVESTEETPLMRVDMSVRSFPPSAPFGIRWDFPLWVQDGKIDLELKTSTRAKKKATGPKERTVEDVLFVLGDQELSTREWRDQAVTRLGINGQQFGELKKRAREQALIVEREDGRKLLCRRALGGVPLVDTGKDAAEDEDELGF